MYEAIVWSQLMTRYDTLGSEINQTTGQQNIKLKQIQFNGNNIFY